MKNSFSLFCGLFLLCISSLFAQDILSTKKPFGFPSKKYGLGIGNSTEFNGIRFNFADENVKVVNGLNFTLWVKTAKNMGCTVNGISMGTFPVGGTMQFLNLGILGVGGEHSVNGLTLTGFMAAGGYMNGVCVSGMFLSAGAEINGLAFGGLAAGTAGNINGIASSLVYLSAEESFNGLAFTPGFLISKTFSGVAVAGYANTQQMNGISIALVNRTNELRGIQLGLLNIAANNPKLLKRTPLINFHF